MAVYERCLLEAERILAADKDIIVPVKKVWTLVARQGQSQNFDVPALADFTALLEAHPTFEFMAAHDGVLDDMDEERPEQLTAEEEDLERMGFYAGDRVKLKRIRLTPEALGGILRTKVDRTVDALSKAWQRRPAGDSETEERLLAIISQTKKLQRDVKAAFSEEKMKKVSKALKKKRPAAAASPAAKRSSKGKGRTAKRRSGKAAPKRSSRTRARH